MPTITVYSYRRFSSAIQAKGSSLQRQSDAVSKWLEAKAKDKGLMS